MLRKNYFIFVLMIAAVLVGNIVTFAQSAPPVNGRVVMKDAEGKAKPVANALVEPYRTDINTKLPGDKTSKKGEFAFASFQLGATYALVITGEGIDPLIIPGVKAGATNLMITVAPGKGNVLTEEEVRDQLTTASLGAAAQAGPSEDDKKKNEELEKQIKETEANNVKSKEFNESINKSLAEGNKAFTDKNYDLAVSKFEEGYNASPTFLGSAPGFLNNRGIALGSRAVDYHNKGVQNKETRAANYAKANEDFNSGIDSFYESWTLLKNASEADKAAYSNYQSNKMLALSGARNIIGYTVQTEKVNPEKLDKVKELLGEYLKAESDKAKKSEAEILLADYYRGAGNFDMAITEYRKVLSSSPKEPGALFGLGISLVSTGYNDDGTIKKDRLQEAANTLSRFVDVAPAASKKQLTDAKNTLNELKDGNGISPKK